MSDRAREAIESANNEPLVSTASLWEMGIKISLGKLALETGLLCWVSLPTTCRGSYPCHSIIATRSIVC